MLFRPFLRLSWIKVKAEEVYTARQSSSFSGEFVLSFDPSLVTNRNDRALIIIHSHNLNYITTESNLNPESILKEKEKRLESSHAAMETITAMVDEISTTHTSVLALVDTIPPSFVYVIREVLKYIQDAEFRADDVERRLSSASRKFEYRWGGRQI